MIPVIAIVPPPIEDEITAGFWAEVAGGRLAVQSCLDCDSRYLPPRYICEHCHGTRFTYAATSGKGVIHSYTWVHTARHAAFERMVPYPVALISLDDAPGINVLSNLRGMQPHEVVIGKAVEFYPFEVAPGRWIPEFRTSLD